MPYGTEPFTNGNGDYIQPTVIDYDKKLNATYNKKPWDTTPEERERIKKQYEQDQLDAYNRILEINPVFARDFYKEIVKTQDNKLVWNIEKLDEMKTNVTWLYELKRELEKAEELFYAKKT